MLPRMPDAATQDDCQLGAHGACVCFTGMASRIRHPSTKQRRSFHAGRWTLMWMWWASCDGPFLSAPAPKPLTAYAAMSRNG